MKDYLKNVANQLRNHSLTLDKHSILIDKPWALIDDEFELQKLIFKSNKELVLSKNGKVQIGRWDYFPEARCILIDRNVDKLLCNEAFIDKGVLVLKLDGTENKFFVLANENIIPDLNVARYLENLRNTKLKIIHKRLNDNRILEVHTKETWIGARPGDRVSIETEGVEDGKYNLNEAGLIYEIKKGEIFKILTEVNYVLPSGQEIVIQQQSPGFIERGDYVFINGEQFLNGLLDFTRSRRLFIQNGEVIRSEYKNGILRSISKVIKVFIGNYQE